MPRSSTAAARSAVRRIHYLIFLYSFGIALATYIESSYLRSATGSQSIEWIFIAANAVAILSMLMLPTVVRRTGKRKGFRIMAILLLASSALLSLVISPLVAVVSFVVFTAALWLVLLGFDVALEQYSSDPQTGRLRGRYLTIMNAGWVAAPAVMGFVGERFGIPSVFGAAAIVMLPIVALLPSVFKTTDDRKFHHHEQLKDAVKRIINEDALWKVMLAAFALQFFYAWMVIYAPLYLHETVGLSWSTIGWIFSIMLVPFVLTEYPAGFVADRWWGEKELLGIGFAIMVGTSIAFGVMEASWWAAFAGVLFLSRVGASIVESMRDAYFYKHVDSDDIALISVFHMVWLLPYSIAPFIAGRMLSTVGYQDLFVVLGGILAVLVVPTLYKMPDTQ